MTASAADSDWTVVVLTGGLSRRMGSDKATLEVAGRTLLERTLEGVPDDVAVVVAGPAVRLSRGGVTFVQEEPAGGGPVAGLDAALAVVATPMIVLLATDLPFAGRLPGALARSLRESADETDAALAASTDGRPQQLCAAYRVDALRAAIAANGPVAGAAMHRVLAHLRTRTIGIAATHGADATWDIDTPEDVQRLAELLAQITRGELMDKWVEQLAKALELPAAVDVDTMLDVARDVAHNVERKATPVTTYLMGVAVGGGMPEEVVVERVRGLVEGWTSTNG